jgi:hypothetical protein
VLPIPGIACDRFEVIDRLATADHVQILLGIQDHGEALAPQRLVTELINASHTGVQAREQTSDHDTGA